MSGGWQGGGGRWGTIIKNDSNGVDSPKTNLSVHSCTVFWMVGSSCYGAMCGNDCFKSTARAVAKKHTFYARTDVVKKGIVFSKTVAAVASSVWICNKTLI